MPGFTTHYLFGVKAYNDLPNNYLKHVISKYRWLYQLGLQGPDIFFYNVPILRHRTVRHKALQLHISRIFDNPRWVNFIPFNREYRPEVLEHASLVTVINECCGKPGEVTQEQIDGACTGTVACPHCGRWSSFSIVEPKQAEEQGMEMI